MSGNGTTEKVRTLLEAEGVNARNLIAWRVPNEVAQQHSAIRRLSRKVRANALYSATSTNTNSDESEAEVRSIANSLLSSSTNTTSRSFGKFPRNSLRPRPSSADRQRIPPTGDSRARFWGMLIENLKRSVDELYVACESDASEVECREVMMVLELCVADFRHLIEKLRVLRVYEASREAGKCVSVSWNERKTSPAKPLFTSPSSRRTAAMRMLSTALSGGLLRNAEQLSPYLVSSTTENVDEVDTETETDSNSNIDSPNGSTIRRPAATPTLDPIVNPSESADSQSVNTTTNSLLTAAKPVTVNTCTPITVNALFALAAQTDSAKAKANSGVKSTGGVSKQRPTPNVSASKARPATVGQPAQPQVTETSSNGTNAASVNSHPTNEPLKLEMPAVESDGETGWSKVGKRAKPTPQAAAAQARARANANANANASASAKQQQLLTDPKSLRRYKSGDLKQQRAYGKSVSDNQLHRATASGNARFGGKSHPSAVREDDDAPAGAVASLSSTDMQNTLGSMKHPSDGELRPTPNSTPTSDGKPNWSQIVAGAGRPKVLAAGSPQLKVASAESIAGSKSKPDISQSAPAPSRPHARSDPMNTTVDVVAADTNSSTSTITEQAKVPSSNLTPALNYAAKVKGVAKTTESSAAGSKSTAANARKASQSTAKGSAVASGNSSNVRPKTTPGATASTARGNTTTTGARLSSKTSNPKAAAQKTASSQAQASQPAAKRNVESETEPQNATEVELDSANNSLKLSDSSNDQIEVSPLSQAEAEAEAESMAASRVMEEESEDRLKLTELLKSEESLTASWTPGIGDGDGDCDGESESAARDNEENTVDERIREIELALDAVTMREVQLATEIEDAQKQLDNDRNEPLNLADSVASTLSLRSASRTGRSSSQAASADASGTTVAAAAQSMVDVEMVLRAIDHGVVELSWMEMLELEERERAAACAATRTPGRSVHMHEKLSSPSRKRATEEDPEIRKHRQEEKQRRAEEARERLLRERLDSLHELNRKISETRKQREQLQVAQKAALGHKMELADRKRQSVLEAKVQRAQEESEKANEIAFINKLEAANRQHDILVKQQEVEQRLHDAEEERLRKAGEAKTKMIEAEERRKLIENERLQKLQELQQKRQRREQHVELMQAEREQQRLEKKEANQRDREERIAQLQARREGHREVIRSKIQAKQEASERLYLEHVQHVRTKAQEMRIPKHSPLLAQAVRQREAASVGVGADADADDFIDDVLKADDDSRAANKENNKNSTLSQDETAQQTSTASPSHSQATELQEEEEEEETEAKQSKRKLRKLQEREAREERKLAKKLAKKAVVDTDAAKQATAASTPTAVAVAVAATPVATSTSTSTVDETCAKPPKSQPLAVAKFCSTCKVLLRSELEVRAHRAAGGEPCPCPCSLGDATDEQTRLFHDAEHNETDKRSKNMLKRKTKLLQRLRKAQSLPTDTPVGAAAGETSASASAVATPSWLTPVAFPLLAATQKSVQKFTRDFRTLIHGANESGPWSAKKVQVFERLLLDAERSLFAPTTVSSNVSAAWWQEFETTGLLDAAFHLLERDLQSANGGSSRDRRVAKVPDSSLVQVSKFICKCFQVLSCNVDVNAAFVRHLLTKRSDRLLILLDLLVSRLGRALDGTDAPSSASETPVDAGASSRKPRETNSKKDRNQSAKAGDSTGRSLELAPILNSILQLLNQFWLMLDSCKRSKEDAALRNAELDIISYLVAAGVVDRLGLVFAAKHALGAAASGSGAKAATGSSSAADRRTDEYEFAYLTSLLLVLLLRRGRTLASGSDGSDSRRLSVASSSGSSVAQAAGQPNTSQPADSNGLLDALLRRMSPFVNILKLLYNTLVVDRIELDSLVARVAVCAFKIVNECACSDAAATQAILGQNTTRFEFAHVCGLLLSQATRQPKIYEALISEVIVSIGYFARSSKLHQDWLRESLCSGIPCIMAQLCSVPMEYFIDAKLSRVLYPTLLAACFENANNTQLMEAEVSSKLLANFLEEKLLDAEQEDTSGLPAAATLTYSAETRFPRRYWQPAVAYFCAKQH